MLPVVSVLMPVHNGETYLQEAIASLERQTLDEWELIAVLDRCSDATRRILESAGDSRIRIVDGPRPGGLILSLNCGLALCRAPYVARFDADDVCERERLAVQKAALDARRDLVVLGTSATRIDRDSKEIGFFPVTCGTPQLRRRLLWRNSLIHSSVMFRLETVVAVGGYNPRMLRAEDYELWLRVAAVGEIDNLPRPLIRYRIHAGQSSRRRPYVPSFRLLLQARRQLGEKERVSPGGVLLRHTAWAVWQQLPWKWPLP